MSSWVYLISKFTPEMLFLESVAILTLLGSYAAFWVIRKRKHGPAKDVVPAGVVKEYLNELIREANQMRTTMFGILSAAGMEIPAEGAMPSLGAGAGVTVDPSVFKKVGELESKMSEQAKAMQAIAAEKARIEKELADAKAAGLAAGGAAPQDTSVVDELKRRIALLESKLAEYSVIEDDLANLKKLQQENAQLRAALGEQKAPTAAASVAAPAAPAAPAAAAPNPAPVVDAAPPLEAATAEASFEGLVDKVEESLAQAAPAPAEPAPAPKAAPAKEMLAEATASVENAEPVATQAAAAGDADADLVAEFEKMLNS